jgi:hypothetical protein
MASVFKLCGYFVESKRDFSTAVPRSDDAAALPARYQPYRRTAARNAGAATIQDLFHAEI